MLEWLGSSLSSALVLLQPDAALAVVSIYYVNQWMDELLYKKLSENGMKQMGCKVMAMASLSVI